MAWGKEPNKLDIKTLDCEYLEILGGGSGGSIEKLIVIDTGDPDKTYGVVLDSNGNEISFTTMIQALTFFSKHGYELVSAYGSSAGNFSQSNYVIRKKK